MKAVVAAKELRASFRDYVSFTKAILSSAVGIPGLLVYLLVADSMDPSIYIAMLAIFLLALGVSALNQFQEQELDALMPRTQNRPLVTGRISQKEGVSIILGLIGFSMLAIYSVLGFAGVGIFVLVVFLYNGVYTPMKRTSAYAVFPGALLGVIPPVICWMVAGESVMQLSFAVLAWFYFIWQIPHFWLLVLIYQQDYNKAKFPNMANVLGAQSLSRVTYVWIILTIISALMTVSFFIPQSQIILALIVLHSLFMMYKGSVLLRPDTWRDKKLCRKTFMQLNLYTLLVIGFLVVDRWLISA